MAERSTEVLLAELLVTSKDGDWGMGEPADGHVPYYVIRGADFTAVRIGKVVSVPLRYLPEGTVARRTLAAGDIIIETAGGTRDRPTGRTLLVTSQILEQFSRPVTCASFARFLRVDRKRADPEYVFWFLQHIYTLGEMFQHQVQHTGVARFQYTKFAASRLIPLPILAEQKAIAEVLGALDDKIAANTKLAQTADELSRMIFMSVPGSDLEQVPLSSTARFINGKAFTKGASGTGRVVIRIAELNSGLGGSTVYNDIEVADDHVARPGDLLFAWSGSLTLSRWFREEGIVNQHIFKVLPGAKYPNWLVYQLIQQKLLAFQDIAADKATTMGHIQRHHLDEAVGVPTREWIQSRDGAMSGLWQTALLAEQESLQLIKTRDTFLPQLMSGKLRVRDAEKLVEEVV